ncbi:cytochrome aa3 quinol oxidase subunit IV [Salibacterium qingdaonense]|uniref:Quinol oxidase subunit 4 n=1 Tax=Salibacterium qingdaonense TaxID=266892 RepID=A0A1I4I4R2_9BACI|nr:cytochrome aa3 quinol oxidase subunit IV [Salibacterium qingdaonense]SFL48993.1 cytochrome aa3-600 menaquinol oxidase subunit 4 [Salibacterium qingdaonense]
MSAENEKFPKQHIVGFLGSLVLTLAAAWAAVGSGLPTIWIIVSIMVMAVVQAFIQLFMFMHLTEKNGSIQVGNMLHAFFIAAVIIAGSVWTMSFGFSHNHSDDGGGGEEMQMEEQEHNH